MKIGIDLLWVRPGICGGTESYIRTLMHGFGRFDSENEYILFVAGDNADSFAEYAEYPNLKLHVCPVLCAVQFKRILWENLNLDKTAGRLGVDVMFIPVYSKPRTFGSKIPYICVIHDLQAWHFPQYFSKVRSLFMKYMWSYTCKSARRVLTISEYCKKDIVEHYPKVREKCEVIYIPVEVTESGMDISSLQDKYGIEKDKYFYCVSSMLPHKNLETLLHTMQLRKQQGYPEKMVISGVGGQKEEFQKKVEELGIGELVVDTGFVSDRERDCLYENCKLFLFPSVFEGFGMPTIEALGRGKIVITTRESCLEEVTKGKAVYVDSPYDENAWAEKIQWAMTQTGVPVDFADYSLDKIVAKYVEVFTKQ